MRPGFHQSTETALTVRCKLKRNCQHVHKSIQGTGTTAWAIAPHGGGVPIHIGIQWRQHCSCLTHSALTLAVRYLNPDLRVHTMYSMWFFRRWSELWISWIITVPSNGSLQTHVLTHQRYLNGALTGVQTNCIQLFPFDSFSPLDSPLNRFRFNILSEYNRG